MKYKLRSLTRFSIRDLMLLTLFVALAAWGWTERSRLQQENVRLSREKDFWKVQYFDEHNAHLAASHQSRGWQALHAEVVSEAERLKRLVDETERLKRNAALSDSLAPAPNPRNP